MRKILCNATVNNKSRLRLSIKKLTFHITILLLSQKHLLVPCLPCIPNRILNDNRILKFYLVLTWAIDSLTECLSN